MSPANEAMYMIGFMFGHVTALFIAIIIIVTA